MNGANSHVLSSLVWFREPPSPRPWLVFWKPSSWIFFRMPGLSTFIIIKISSGLYKTEWKARVEAQTKGERKSRKGGRSIVLVFTDDTSLSNFHFWVLSLFSYLDWKKEKTSLSFFLFFFFPSTNFGYDQCPTSWIGVRKLPEKRQSKRCTLDWTRRISFCQRSFFRKILHW